MMEKENIYKDLIELLKQHGELFAENGSLFKNKVQELTLKNDKKLIELLLGSPRFNELYFFKVGSTTIFDKDSFIGLVCNKKFLPDSYTKFSEKIGLASGNEFVIKNKDVVLNWPYKDCVLEGGMTKEEEGRDEIFWNEIIAPEHVTRLESPKAFINVQRVDGKGSKPLKNLIRDNEGTIKDNLIIKGNNLLALHSLKEQFAGKVKLIYIDPPYNTENDSLKYSDRFNHSSWITFMKNRLEVSKHLLRKDGVVFVHCDDNEQAYLKVLMDEILGRENSIAFFVRKVSSSARLDAKYISVETDYIFLYAKNIQYASINKNEYELKGYNLSDEHANDRGKYKLNKLDRGSLSYSSDLDYPIKVPDGSIVYPGGTSDNNGWTWRWSEAKLKWGIKTDYIVFKQVKGEWKVYYKIYEHVNNNLEKEKRILPYKNLIMDSFNEEGTREHRTLFNEKKFDNPKPESLMSIILEIATIPGDIVLDYHLGSGTTAAVAHKMGRQYIGVEQMDYIEDVACRRLNKVIGGEQGGVSELAEWKGGGEFVYLELAEWNQKWVGEIKKATTAKETIALWGKIKDNAFLSYKIDVKTIDESADEFKDLSVDDQKKFLLDCLDANHLYINYSEIDDEEYGMNSNDKELSHKFYDK